MLQTRLYSCSNSQLVEATPARCADCRFWKPYFLRDVGHHYKQVDVGKCTSTGMDMRFKDLACGTCKACKDFEPADAAAFKNVWIRTIPN